VVGHEDYPHSPVHLVPEDLHSPDAQESGGGTVSAAHPAAGIDSGKDCRRRPVDQRRQLNGDSTSSDTNSIRCAPLHSK
jgi:hypothetical protein